jgi:hypothetical protein
MKKVAVVIALLVSILVPSHAQAAQTIFLGGPLKDLDSPASIHIAFSNFPTSGGLYVMQCVESAIGTRPTICNPAVQIWVSNDSNATFKPNADIVFKPTSTFSGADCTIVKCGIFIRYDHTVPNNFTEDQFFALTFKAGAPALNTLTPDEITATINGVALSNKSPLKLAYRDLAVLAATSKSGAVLTFNSLAPACALNGVKISVLKGSGFCDIAITSPGSSNSSPVTAHFPLELTLGNQSIGAVAAFSSKKTKLPAVTNFGESVTYSASGSCTTSKYVLKTKRGICTIIAKASGVADLYNPLTKKFILKVK